MSRVLVADDSSLIRSAIKDVLQESGEFEVVAEAASGIETLMMARRTRPDIISLDVEMPRIDGLGVLSRLMKTQPTKVVLVSSLTAIGADVTLEGLARGALDFVPKATVGEPFDHFAGRLLHVFRTVQAAKAPGRPTPHLDPTEEIPELRRPSIVAVAASTGGPEALSRFVGSFAERPPVPFILVQHMPATFTSRLAARLDRGSTLAVLEAFDGAAVEAGAALVAPGGHHLVMHDGMLGLDDGPPVGGLRPRADLTFNSIAEHFADDALAVVLTGMGDDGVAGSAAISKAGGQVLTQDGESATVDGMPARVREAGISIGSAPPESLAAWIEATWTPVPAEGAVV